MPTAVTDKTTNSSLPKISGSSRNNAGGGTLQSHTHSTKSQVRGGGAHAAALNMSMSQEGGTGVGEETREEDNYEGDMFEHDENKQHHLPQVV
jgi:hypothetical protein